MNSNYYDPKQQMLIQQMFTKIEQLIIEISKLTQFSNQLLQNLQIQEMQYKNLKQQFNDVWQCLNEKQKIWFNLRNNTQHYTISNEPLIMSRLITDIQSRVTEIQQFNYQQTDLFGGKKCLSCQEKDYKIHELKAQIQKQAQILYAIQQDTSTQPPQIYYQNDFQRIHTDDPSRQRVSSQKLFQSNFSTASSHGSKF